MENITVWFIVQRLLEVLAVGCFALVVRKARYSPWWALLGLVPIVNIVALYVFAYREWPARPASDAAPIKST
jgi:hypothetical protein